MKEPGPTSSAVKELSCRADVQPMAAYLGKPEDDPELERKRLALIAEIRSRSVGRRAATPGVSDERRARRIAGVRMRTLLLPAFAIVVMIHFGSRAGAPLGVHAGFTPSPNGKSFAGPRVFDEHGMAEVTLAPGDVVGTLEGATSTLALGDGTLELEKGARAVVASLMPPRARLIGGRARIKGKLRVVTAMGVIDVDDGEADVSLDESGLEVELLHGAGVLTAPEGRVELLPGQVAASR